VHQGLVEVEVILPGLGSRSRMARRESDSRPLQFLGFYDDVCVRTAEVGVSRDGLSCRATSAAGGLTGGCSRSTACPLGDLAVGAMRSAAPRHGHRGPFRLRTASLHHRTVHDPEAVHTAHA